MPGDDTNNAVFKHRSDLFRTSDGKPMCFSMHPCLERSRIEPPITHGGGKIGLFNKTTKCYSQDSIIRLVPPVCAVFTDDSYSSKYIWDCVASNKLLNIDNYKRVEEIVEQDDFDDDSSDDSIHVIKTKPRRRQLSIPYSRTEDVEIVAFIIKERAFRYIAGNELWKRMEKDLRLRNERSWESLKNRFKKKILPNIVSYTDDKKTRESFEKRRDLISESDSKPVYSMKSNYFTKDDDYSILNYIKMTDMCYLNGCDIWKRMQSRKITRHSWQSMRNRFLRQIVVNLDKYEMSKNDRARFQREVSNPTSVMNNLEEEVSYDRASKRMRVLPLNEHDEMNTENESVNSSPIITANRPELTICPTSVEACKRSFKVTSVSEKAEKATQSKQKENSNSEYSIGLPQCSSAGTSGATWINVQHARLRKPLSFHSSHGKRNLTSKTQLSVLFEQTPPRCQTSEKIQNTVDVLSLSRNPTPLIEGDNAASDVAAFNQTNNVTCIVDDGNERQTSIKLNKNVGSSESVVDMDTLETAELDNSVVKIDLGTNQISEQVLTIGDDCNASNDSPDVTDRTTVEIIKTPVDIVLSDSPEKDVAAVVVVVDEERINEKKVDAIEEQHLAAAVVIVDRRINSEEEGRAIEDKDSLDRHATPESPQIQESEMHTNDEIVLCSSDFALNFISMGIEKELDSWMESLVQDEHIDIQESPIEKCSDADTTKPRVTGEDCNSDVRDNSDDDEPEGIYEGWPDGLKKILFCDTTRTPTHLQIEEIFQVLKWCGLRLNMKNHQLIRFLQAMYAHDADKLLQNIRK